LSTRLVALCFDANDPLRLARFWAATLHWDIYDETDEEISLVPTDGTRFLLLFLPVPEPKTANNRIHLDLVSNSSLSHGRLSEDYDGSSGTSKFVPPE
jgi:hypothetical protein